MIFSVIIAGGLTAFIYNGTLARTQSNNHALREGKRFLGTMLFVWMVISVATYNSDSGLPLAASWVYDGAVFAFAMAFLYFWHMRKTPKDDT